MKDGWIAEESGPTPARLRLAWGTMILLRNEALI
ncbi:hypothetical protein ACP_0523 [Acidobacterium capsulatum ATCC 51196]|uniref:Uncharacterized protein n=1 Tax=Acidobacterium capsulatum (strain ATCC 51196 / DSM 11244 / BCRC 80197 / JCM 7670 / NBRC 15755 / NCIMB 13165 / 161) TaxID=240015 RepID=C1F122_ACIC5|nr:hypothetical protein ACP_0523 [Acidobacterium capsulatum ATCC 51196]